MSRPYPRRRPLGMALAALLLSLTLPGSLRPAHAAEERLVRRPDAHIGYASPAGGARGSTFTCKVGGQNLRGAESVHVSGGGVTAKVVWWLPPARPLDRNVARALRRRLAQLARARRTPGRTAPPAARARDRAGAVELPKHVLLDDLESKSLEELREVAAYFFRRRNPLQDKRSIAETVKLEVTLAPDAEPGLRDLRLLTRAGLTNPLRFYVGVLPEVMEEEPFPPTKGAVRDVELPAVLNGQILPRDADRFRFQARKGQELVFAVKARDLVPYQADSVPGWMQTTLVLFDEAGREVAYADDYNGIDPDPVLHVEVPADGSYTLEVRDAIARGRADFVYRITAGELPYVCNWFPRGGRAGELTIATLDGYNLGLGQVPLATAPDDVGIQQLAWYQERARTNEIRYHVDTLPEVIEEEPNDTPENAPVWKLPVMVNGRSDWPGDVDAIAFAGRRRQEVVLDVTARCLGSPMDAVVRLRGEDGEVVAWNDDPDAPNIGLETHHADAWLRARLPKTGRYTVEIQDAQGHGGPAYGYRLRVSAPRPDFELLATPSTLNVPAGRSVAVTLHVVRKDGFEGAIDVALADDAEGFRLAGTRIPPGVEKIRMTIRGPARGRGAVHELSLVGRAKIDRDVVERAVVPADDLMQAFLWRHLLPAQALAAHVVGGGRGAVAVTFDGDEPVRLRRGRETTVALSLGGRPLPAEVGFVLDDPPDGIALVEVRRGRKGVELVLEADKDVVERGLETNLIVDGYVEREIRGAKRRVYIGTLPALPVEVR